VMLLKARGVVEAPRATMIPAKGFAARREF
jgi:hypothetical protein